MKNIQIYKDIALLDLVGNYPVESLNFNLQAMPELPVNVFGFSTKILEVFPEGMPGQKGTLSNSSFLFSWKEEILKGYQSSQNKWNIKPRINVNVFGYKGKFKLGFSGAPVCYEGDNKVVGVFIAKDETNGYALPIQTILNKFSSDILVDTTDNQDNSLYLEKGNQYHRKEDFNSAISCYGKIISDANYYYAVFNKALSLRLGYSSGKLGYCHQSIDWYDMALKINPNDVLVLRGKALTLRYLGNDIEAISWYDKALKIDPNDVRSLSNKAISLIELKRYSEAKQYFEKALAINNNYLDSIEGLKKVNELLTRNY